MTTNGNLQDPYKRFITYLRISVTDRCNLRCIYCMPAEGIKWTPRAEILTYEEITKVVEAASSLGVRGVRLTGGEPLVRAELPKLVRMLAGVPGIEDISLSSNGVALRAFAKELREAGLKRVNISLDTLKPERFKDITRVGKLEDVFEGIEAARAVGLGPIKLNCVAMKGRNDDEFAELARLTIDQDLHMRFIELMPFEDAHCSLGMGEKPEFVSMGEIVGAIEAAHGKLSPIEDGEVFGNGPARYYRLPNAKGTVGFISPVTEQHFCARCNRLRLTADGKLRPCLLTDLEVDLRTPLRSGASVEDVRKLFFKTVLIKPESHNLVNGNRPHQRLMVQIGG